MKNYIIISIILFCLYLLLDLDTYKKDIDYYKFRVGKLNDSIAYRDSVILDLKLKRDTLRDSIYIDRIVIKKIKEAPITLSDDELIKELKVQYNK